MNNNKYKKILVRSTNWLGDAVMTTPFFELLRKLFNDAYIEVIAIDYIANLFENNPFIDKISIVKRPKTFFKKIFYAFNALSPFKNFKYDLGISLPNSIGAALDLKYYGCREILGYNRDMRKFLLTIPVNVTKEILCVHESFYYLNLLKVLIKDKNLIDEYFNNISSGFNLSYKLYLTNDEISKAKQYLLNLGININNDIILGVNPGAFFGSAKRWFTDRYALTIKNLCEKFNNLKVLIFGSKSEIEIGNEIIKIVNLNENNVFNLCGKTTIRELMALISLCDHFLTNDSGAMHIAAAFDVPITAIFGPTDFKSTYPLSKNYTIIQKQPECAPCKKRECPKKHHLCMKNIDIDFVTNELISRLNCLEKNIKIENKCNINN